MRLSGFGWVHSMNSPLRWCLCLVLVGIMISGAFGCTQNQEVNLPYISSFKVSSQILKDGDAANYVIKVNNAEEILLYEAGVNIARWNGPPSGTHTHKITFKGMPANAIPTDDGKFEARLIVSNKKGKLEKELQLSVAAPAIPAAGQPGAPDNRTGENKSYWLDQTFVSDASLEPPLETSQETSDASPPMEYPPQFADCDCAGDCNYCLEAGDAASRGYTQCSDELCYSSPNQDKKFYCYKAPEGWCCNDTQVSPANKAQCDQVGGKWYAIKAQAQQACQPMCYCCARDGRVGLVTVDECRSVGGNCYATQYEAMQACQPPCWCCVGGSVYQTNQSQCTQMGGNCYDNQGAAAAACQEVGPIPDDGHRR